MPTIFTHAIAAVALGRLFAGEKMPARFWVLSIFCAVIPDADVISFSYRFQRGSMFGHRGLSHSFLFALLLALLIDDLGLDSCGVARHICLALSQVASPIEVS